MANRTTTHVLKNSDIVNRPLPSTLLKGEPIVNTADGIVFFSGVTTSTNEWTPAGTGTTANFFEVGSNLYDLRLRNRITKYEGASGAGLSGKFLSGTTSGFVLADITSIVGVDTYATAFTYSNNVATIKQNQGQPDLNIVINTMTGLTINGTLSATTINSGTSNINQLNTTAGTINTLVSTNANITNLTAGTFSATTYLNLPTDIRVTGGTPNNATKTYSFTNNTGGTFTVTALTDIFVTGGTYGAGTATFTNSTGGTFTVTGFTGTDTIVTAFTYSNNVLTISQNQGQPQLTALVNTMTGLTVNGTLSATTINTGTSNINQLNVTGGTITTLSTTNLSASAGTVTTLGSTTINVANINVTSALTPSYMTTNRFVYTNTGGTLVTGAAIFDGTNTTLPSTGSLTVGTGGLVIGTGGSPSVAGTGDLVVNGNLTVFGGSVSAFTSNLYVEDNNIGLNYNPTGSTIATSIGAGWTVQDGNGVSGGSVNLNINRLDTLTGLTATNTPSVTEYTGSVGYTNRGWITQLNDIVIRSTDVNTPNGVRVLTEFDVLDGGVY
jgi:hypothetical protein